MFGLGKKSTKKEQNPFYITDQKITELVLFPGTLDEYNQFTDEKHVIMDVAQYKDLLKRPGQKYVEYHYPEGIFGNELSLTLLRRLVRDGCVALIHYRSNWEGVTVESIGLPVKLYVRRRIFNRTSRQ